MISATTAARASCRVMTARVALEMPARTVQLACDSVLALNLSAFEARRTFVFNVSPEGITSRACRFSSETAYVACYPPFQVLAHHHRRSAESPQHPCGWDSVRFAGQLSPESRGREVLVFHVRVEQNESCPCPKWLWHRDGDGDDWPVQSAKTG